MANWEIVEENGKFDVRCNKHSFAYDCDDVEEAVARIKRSRKFSQGDKVIVVDASGYRTNLKRL